MRTKTLLVAGAISALALTASLAQSVYSVNVVGYVNVPVVASGYTCIANPLDATPDDNINNVLPNVTDGSQVVKWTGTAFTAADQYYIDGLGWYTTDGNFTPSALTLEPGEGFFFLSPVATNVTFVGDVRQGALSKNLSKGYNLVSQLTPQSGDIMNFNFPVDDGDQLLYWKATDTPQHYTEAVQYYIDGLGWYTTDGNFTPVTPTINVGQGAFILKAQARTWNLTFTVN